MAPPSKKKSSLHKPPRSSIPRPRNSSIGGTSLSKTPLSVASASARKQSLSSRTPGTARRGASSYESDPRPLFDKTYIKKSIHNLIQALSQLGYPTSLTYRLLNPPTNKEFQNIFSFCVENIIGHWKIVGRADEAMINVIKDLGYPFNIAKSTMNNVGTMGAWPNALGALTWLLGLLEKTRTIHFSMEELFPGKPEDQMRSLYLNDIYHEFMNGSDGPFDRIDDQYKIQMAPIHEAREKENVELKKKNEELFREYQEKRQEKATKENYTRDIEQCRQDMKAINVYISQVDEYVKDKKELERKNREACDKLKEEIDEAKVKLVQIKSTISVQELSSADVVNLNKENQGILRDIKSVKDRHKTLMDSKWAAEMHFTKQIQTMDTLILNYNDNMRKFFSSAKQLNPDNKTSSIDSLSSDGAFLATGFKGTELNHTNCTLNIMPYFRKVVDELLKKNNTLSENLRNMRKRLNQDNETIADLSREDEQLSQKQAKIEQDLKLQKQEHIEIEMKRKKEIEEKMAQLNMLKSCQSGGLAEYQELKRELTAKLKSQTVRIEREQIQMVEDIQEMAEALYQCKNDIYANIEKHREKRDAFVKDNCAKLEAMSKEMEGLIEEKKLTLEEMENLRDAIKARKSDCDP